MFFNPIRGEVVGRDTIKLQTQTAIIDTCFTTDIYMYETAILTNEHTFVVERYDDRVSAEAAHRRWVSMAKKDKKLSFFDPQLRVARVIE